MLLAALAVCSLVLVTWALTRVSAWIVFHDPVWDKMDSEGAVTEHMIAELFLVARNFHLPAIEAVIGCVFLFMLWRILYGPISGVQCLPRSKGPTPAL